MDEYLAQPWYERLRYRLYRHPIVLFVIGPAYRVSDREPLAGRDDDVGLAAVGFDDGEQCGDRASPSSS